VSKKLKKSKKEKLPFWKSEKLPPEIRSLFAHIGKAADNMTHSQWSELIMNGGLAALSAYSFAPRVRRATYHIETEQKGEGYGPFPALKETRRLTDQEAQGFRDRGSYIVELADPPASSDKVFDLSAIPNAFIGPIGLKLATTNGGTPPISQISGLIVLSALGVATMSSLGTLPSAADNLKAWHATDWTYGLSEPFKEAVRRDPIKFGI